jgi:hypothetical protein
LHFITGLGIMLGHLIIFKALLDNLLVKKTPINNCQ